MKSIPIVVGVVLVIVIIGGTYFFVKGSPQPTPQPTPNAELEQINQTALSNATGSANTTESNVKEFTLVASNFKYNPNEIRVNEGDKVKIVLKNNQGMHDLFLDGYNIQTQKIGAGQEETLEFTADKAGTFELWCTIGNHKAQGMIGKLIVE